MPFFLFCCENIFNWRLENNIIKNDSAGLCAAEAQTDPWSQADEIVNNIKKVDFTGEVDNFVTYTFKPQLKTVGPKFGKQLGEIRQYLMEIDGNAAKKELDQNGYLTLKLASGDVKLEVEDLLIDAQQKDGFYTISDRGITVAIDTE